MDGALAHLEPRVGAALDASKSGYFDKLTHFDILDNDGQSSRSIIWAYESNGFHTFELENCY